MLPANIPMPREHGIKWQTNTMAGQERDCGTQSVFYFITFNTFSHTLFLNKGPRIFTLHSALKVI